MNINMFGLLLILLIVGLFVLVLIKVGRKGRWIVGGIALFLLFAVLALRFVGIQRPVRTVTEVRLATRAMPAEVIPAVWQPGIEDQFVEANAYPSMRSAARALGRQLAALLPTVVPDNRTPTMVQVCGQVRAHNGELSHDVLNAMGDALRRENDRITVLVDTIIPDQPIEKTNREAVTVKISLEGWRTSAVAVAVPGTRTSRVRPERSGTLSAVLSGAAGQLTRTIEFVDKPWVENFAEFVNLNPQRHYVLARSQQSCIDPVEAKEQAVIEACNKVRHLLNQLPQQRPVVAGQLEVNPVDIGAELVADRFTQSLHGSVENIWREAILIDASQDNLTRLARQKTEQLWSYRMSWGRIIFSMVGMTLLICVVYLFLNAATRGYYTAALRVAAFVLVIIGVFLILAFIS